MYWYPNYDLEGVLRLTVRNYIALREQITRLRNLRIADMTRAVAYANSKDPRAIIDMYDPPTRRR